MVISFWGWLESIIHARQERDIEFHTSMPPLVKLCEACTKGWFRSLRINRFHFKDEDVRFLSQLHHESIQDQNKFYFELVQGKLSLKDGRKYNTVDDALEFLSEVHMVSTLQDDVVWSNFSKLNCHSNFSRHQLQTEGQHIYTNWKQTKMRQGTNHEEVGLIL